MTKKGNNAIYLECFLNGLESVASQDLVMKETSDTDFTVHCAFETYLYPGFTALFLELAEKSFPMTKRLDTSYKLFMIFD